jgi:uncharacterized protein with HEPN domain
MPPEDEVRVRHLIEATNKAVAYAAGRSREDPDDDKLLRLALTKLVEIVFDINLDVLWSTVTDDLPRLLAVLPDDIVRDGSAPTDRDRRCVDEQ